MSKKQMLSDLESINNVRLTVKDFGRLTGGVPTELRPRKKHTKENIKEIKLWIKQVKPLADAVTDTLKLVPMKQWNMYFLMGGFEGLPEVKQFRRVNKVFLAKVSQRPSCLLIAAVKEKVDEENTNDKA